MSTSSALAPAAFLVLMACSGGAPPDAPVPVPVAEPVTVVEPVVTEPVAEPSPGAEVPAPVPADPGPPSVMPDPVPVVKPAPDAVPPEGFGDPYTVVSAPTLRGLVVTMDVRYGGGCADHVFTWRGGPEADGAPTQQTFLVHHDDADDKCRALKVQTLTFEAGDLLDADCLTAIRVLTPPGPDGKGEYVLPLARPQGCD